MDDLTRLQPGDGFQVGLDVAPHALFLGMVKPAASGQQGQKRQDDRRIHALLEGTDPARAEGAHHPLSRTRQQHAGGERDEDGSGVQRHAGVLAEAVEDRLTDGVFEEGDQSDSSSQERQPLGRANPPARLPPDPEQRQSQQQEVEGG